MSTATTASTATQVATSASVATTPTEWWQRWRRVVLVVAIVLLATIVLAIVNSQSRRGFLDPEAIDATGARAVVRVLESQGVTVTQLRTTADVASAAGGGTTVLVTMPDLLRPTQVRQLTGTGADLVLVAPQASIEEFSDRISPDGSTGPESRDPECDFAEAERAGSVRTGGVLYEVEAPASGCYSMGASASVVSDTLGHGGRLTVLGSPEFLMNRYLDDDGNAALALGILGQHAELVWYRPTLEELADFQPASITDLLPEWVVPVAWQLAIAAGLAALWQARRLGRLVPERLPVVVRAAETTEGRAWLYRRGRARGHAATTLREAATARLRSRLGLPRDAGPGAVATAVTARTGRPETEVSQLLAGSEPPDDPALVRLATDLDNLEQEVRSK